MEDQLEAGLAVFTGGFILNILSQISTKIQGTELSLWVMLIGLVIIVMAFGED